MEEANRKSNEERNTRLALEKEVNRKLDKERNTRLEIENEKANLKFEREKAKLEIEKEKMRLSLSKKQKFKPKIKPIIKFKPLNKNKNNFINTLKKFII